MSAPHGPACWRRRPVTNRGRYHPTSIESVPAVDVLMWRGSLYRGLWSTGIVRAGGLVERSDAACTAHAQIFGILFQAFRMPRSGAIRETRDAQTSLEPILVALEHIEARGSLLSLREIAKLLRDARALVKQV
jgi:hypothetical protein